jgi:hypothetical protein
VSRAPQASGAVDSRDRIASIGKWALEKSGKYPVNENDEEVAIERGRNAPSINLSFRGARSASPEAISPGCGYGFRACALRRIPE